MTTYNTLEWARKRLAEVTAERDMLCAYIEDARLDETWTDEHGTVWSLVSAAMPQPQEDGDA
jgi:hypothetical protein